jgi:hypothetical protein
MLRRVAQRVATVHIHRGAGRLSPTGNAQRFEPPGSRHARRGRKCASIHVHRLETQYPRCHSSFYRKPLFSIMPESRSARKHASRSAIGFLMNRSIGNCHVSTRLRVTEFEELFRSHPRSSWSVRAVRPPIPSLWRDRRSASRPSFVATGRASAARWQGVQKMSWRAAEDRNPRTG